ncbi:rod shape-determining protein [Acaryochloris marina]|uniref:rod shape-determining protein n=1 Tax=Acaryochloris marina TaxID=155978 RepID=UPI001BB07AAF|nr:rod shape-determining protein [Acaryochloris marina]QUY45473.1 rod shape-determining protein [Acaryochloris marina S15]
MGLLGVFSPDIGIDLGTANTLVYVRGKGIVIRQPTVIARDSENQSILACGHQAQLLEGRQPANVIVSYPLREGVITDIDVAFQLLQQVLDQGLGRKPLFPPRLTLAIPNGATNIERRALQDIAEQAGAKDISIIDEAIAAAIGADLPIDKPLGNMIVDIGGGTTEVAVISLFGVVNSQSIRVAGTHMDDTIRQSLKRNYGLLIGLQTAQAIKHKLGSALIHPQWDIEEMEVGGRSSQSGLPKQLNLEGSQVRDMLQKEFALIVNTVQQTLEKLSPELVSDIYTNGIMLCGGGALLRGLDRLISQETGIFVHVAPKPLDCVALGIGKILEDRQRWDRVFISSAD